MPIYEFRCLQCGHVFELINFKKDEQTEMKCPECGGREICLLYTSPSPRDVEESRMPSSA